MAGSCGRWAGWGSVSFRLPPGGWSALGLLAITQVVVVALPEEVFFRGYLYSRLEQRWPSTRRFLGAPVGRTLLVTSALFALGHVLVDFNVQRSAVFVSGAGVRLDARPHRLGGRRGPVPRPVQPVLRRAAHVVLSIALNQPGGRDSASRISAAVMLEVFR